MLFLAKTITTGEIVSQILFFGGVILLLYLFMYAPQRKKQKQQKDFRGSLKEGDMVVTIGGLHAKIHALDELTVTLMADKNTKLVFDRFAISPEATRRLQEKTPKTNA